MFYFFAELKARNETLFVYGLICLIASFVFLIFTKTSNVQVYGVNVWLKPFKFAFSTFLYVWTMAWYCHYLSNFTISIFNWTVILLLGFEIVYIAFMASKGSTSHYNVSTSTYSVLFSLMALAATLVTLYTGYIAILFFSQTFATLPLYYVWAIRLSLVIFVIFAFEGFVMGSRMSHTVGAINDNSNWFIIGWSKTVGDLRISHFIGMHALQVLPILSFYLIENTKITVFISILYGLLAFTTLIQALQGKPLFTSKREQNAIINERKE